jgi:hypothetical protein
VPLARVTTATVDTDGLFEPTGGCATGATTVAPLLRVLSAPGPELLPTSELALLETSAGSRPAVTRAIISANSTRKVASVITASGKTPLSACVSLLRASASGAPKALPGLRETDGQAAVPAGSVTAATTAAVAAVAAAGARGHRVP